MKHKSALKQGRFSRESSQTYRENKASPYPLAPHNQS